VRSVVLPRGHWQRQIARLDPEVDFEQIARITALHEFPWDSQQALSLALFRTYAVPSIGRLLHETGRRSGGTTTPSSSSRRSPSGGWSRRTAEPACVA
jgi:hypothetical protein